MHDDIVIRPLSPSFFPLSLIFLMSDPPAALLVCLSPVCLPVKAVGTCHYPKPLLYVRNVMIILEIFTRIINHKCQCTLLQPRIMVLVAIPVMPVAS